MSMFWSPHTNGFINMNSYSSSFTLMMLVYFVLPGTLLACSLGGLPRGTQDPLDCTDLRLASNTLVAALAEHEPPLTGGGLDPGEGEVALQILEGEGAAWYHPVPRSDTITYFYEDPVNGSFWSVHVKLSCSEEATATVVFAREDGGVGPLSVGEYPLVGVGIDVPDVEQGSHLVTFDGATVVLTEVGLSQDGGEWISGYLDGGGQGTILSYLTGDEVGPEWVIGAAAFREVPVY